MSKMSVDANSKPIPVLRIGPTSIAGGSAGNPSQAGPFKDSTTVIRITSDGAATAKMNSVAGPFDCLLVPGVIEYFRVGKGDVVNFFSIEDAAIYVTEME